MKTCRRLAALAASLCLIFCLTGAVADEYTAAGLFTITYDGESYLLDNATYQGDMTDTYRWLFLLYSDGMLIDVGIEALPGHEGLTLYTATEAERQSHLDEFLRDESVVYLETLEPSGIPFHIFRLEDDEGPYLLAETVVQGYAIDFCAYYDDHTHPAGEALLSALKDVVETFAPER